MAAQSCHLGTLLTRLSPGQGPGAVDEQGAAHLAPRRPIKEKNLCCHHQGCWSGETSTGSVHSAHGKLDHNFTPELDQMVG